MAGIPSGVGHRDDQDYPAITMGQATQLLGVRSSFLRSLDAAGVLQPQRSGQGVGTAATPGVSGSSRPGCGSCSTRG